MTSDSAPDRLLVLVTGTGRSGTSTMSGTLHHLGLHVPGPFLGTNESNPKGFFESRWAVRFHKAVAQRAGINQFDSRPEAAARFTAAVTDEDRVKLAAFVAERGQGHAQMAVKDPRSIWAQDLWRDAAAADGRGMRYVSMLRHPSEVVGSRTTYYASDEAERRRAYEIFNVARWVNQSLVNERGTRGERRTFVLYTDMLADWRGTMGQLSERLGLTFAPDLSVRPHPVDDFIDPDLRRHEISWDGMSVPDRLRDLAEEVWDQSQLLAEDPTRDVSAAMDALAERYAEYLFEAAAMAQDTTESAAMRARAAAAAQAQAEAEQVAPAPDVDARLIGQTGSKDLLRTVAGRLRAKVRR